MRSPQLIRRLAAWMNFDLEYYVSGAALLAVDQVLTMAIGFATTWCFTNLVAKTVFGAYSYLMAIAGLLTMVALPGVAQAIQRSAARGFDGAFNVGVKLRLKAGAVAGGIMFLVAILLFALGRGMEAKGALIVSVLFPLAFVLDDFRSVLFAKQRFGVFLILHSLIQAGVAAATIIALILQWSFPVILLANLAARSAGNIFAYFFIKYRYLTNDQVDDDFHRFGWNLSLLGIAGGISFQLDKIMVGGFLGLEAIAAYDLAFRLTDQLRNIGVFMFKLLFPRAVRVSGAAVARRFFSRVIPLAAALALIGLMVSVLLGPFMGWLFPKYPEAVSLARWLTWSALLSVVLIYLETYYLSQERFHRTYYVVNLARPFGIIILLPIFFHYWGVLGVIWTTLLVRLINAVLLFAKLGYDRRLLMREELAAGGVKTDLPVEAIRCPLCGDPEAQSLMQVIDYQGRYPGHFAVAGCQSCGLPRQAPRVIFSRPPEVTHRPWTEKILNGEKERQRLETWVNWVTAGRPGPLEIGWSQYLQACRGRLSLSRAANRVHPLAFVGTGKRVLIVGREDRNLAEQLSALQWQVTTAKEIEKAISPTDVYDAIVVLEGLNYLPDPAAALRVVRGLLAREGLLIIHQSWFDGWLAKLAGPFWADLDLPRQQVLFTRGLLSAAACFAGFRVAARVDHSCLASWTESLSRRLAGSPIANWASRIMARRWFHALWTWPVRFLDLIGRGDAGYVIAVRDDRAQAGWAPREIRENLVR